MAVTGPNHYNRTIPSLLVLKAVTFSGSRGSPPEPGSGPHGRPGLPALHQDQHLLLGEDPEAQLQEEEVPHQTSSRRIRK